VKSEDNHHANIMTKNLSIHLHNKHNKHNNAIMNGS